MAALRNYDSDERSNIRQEIFESLSTTNNELELLIQEINNTRNQIEKFKNLLKENIPHCSSLEAADLVEKFLAEQLDVLMKPRFEIQKSMDELQLLLMDEDCILPHKDEKFWVLVSEIKKNHESISQIIKDFNKNQDVYLFNEMMKPSQTNNLDDESVCQHI